MLFKPQKKNDSGSLKNQLRFITVLLFTQKVWDEYTKDRLYETLAGALNNLQEENYNGGITLPATRIEFMSLAFRLFNNGQVEPEGSIEIHKLPSFRYHYSLNKTVCRCLGNCIKQLSEGMEINDDNPLFEQFLRTLLHGKVVSFKALWEGATTHLSVYLKIILFLLVFQNDWNARKYVACYKHMAAAINAMGENNQQQKKDLPESLAQLHSQLRPSGRTKSNLH